MRTLGMVLLPILTAVGQNLEVKVYDAWSLQPIPLAGVTLGSGAQAFTDHRGVARSPRARR